MKMIEKLDSFPSGEVTKRDLPKIGFHPSLLVSIISYTSASVKTYERRPKICLVKSLHKQKV